MNFALFPCIYPVGNVRWLALESELIVYENGCTSGRFTTYYSFNPLHLFVPALAREVSASRWRLCTLHSSFTDTSRKSIAYQRTKPMHETIKMGLFPAHHPGIPAFATVTRTMYHIYLLLSQRAGARAPYLINQSVGSHFGRAPENMENKYGTKWKNKKMHADKHTKERRDAPHAPHSANTNQLYASFNDYLLCNPRRI